MFKKLLTAFAALALLTSLAACGPVSSTEETGTDPSAPTGQTAPSTTTATEGKKPFEEQVLVDNELVTVKLTGVDEKNFWGYTLKVFLENKTDKSLMYTIDNVSVNGFMCDPFWAVTVAGGKKANEEISFGEGDFEKNGIETVEEIAFTLRIYNSDDWLEEDLVNQTFTINP
ncbi:MAG: hypothetical protein E7439_01480 [Ruminococcaceae bacterium]|nr:hypothetical protein [Oscillospiraceae bacterium]